MLKSDQNNALFASSIVGKWVEFRCDHGITFPATKGICECVIRTDEGDWNFLCGKHWCCVENIYYISKG